MVPFRRRSPAERPRTSCIKFKNNLIFFFFNFILISVNLARDNRLEVDENTNFGVQNVSTSDGNFTGGNQYIYIKQYIFVENVVKT